MVFCKSIKRATTSFIHQMEQLILLESSTESTIIFLFKLNCQLYRKFRMKKVVLVHLFVRTYRFQVPSSRYWALMLNSFHFCFLFFTTNHIIKITKGLLYLVKLLWFASVLDYFSLLPQNFILLHIYLYILTLVPALVLLDCCRPE